MKIEVTQADIDEGARRLRGPVSPALPTKNCPVAIAFQRATDDTEAWWAYGEGNSKRLGNFRAVDKPLVSGWTRRFDASARVKPFSFEVEEGWSDE